MPTKLILQFKCKNVSKKSISYFLSQKENDVKTFYLLFILIVIFLIYRKVSEVFKIWWKIKFSDKIFQKK